MQDPIETCRRCWWHEGGRCYNESFADIQVEGSRRIGEDCDTPEIIEKCLASGGYWNKRKALSSVIPNDMLVITSELRK